LAVVIAENARFTILTSHLIRLEYSANGQFEDRASQPFWYRKQPVPVFTVNRTDTDLTIDTDNLVLNYHISEAGFTPETLSIQLKCNQIVWHYGDVDKGNLLGTTRTLDNISGQTVLEQGLMSRTGWAVVNDSKTLVFDDRGWLQTREDNGNALDLYFFGYGQDYQTCLRDYFKLAGKIPMLPRFVLGNWWSRYHAYTQEELTSLMLEFIAQEIPLSVCIVDMDWHITKTGNTSSGWTGYTWNRDLFPDPEGFINFLHELGLKTALNLHPADGVHPHEMIYPEFARRLAITDGQPVKFAIEDPAFAEAYFTMLHHPLEQQGVDFWWMDWQQGTLTGKPGLDPLWWLNHLHFLDFERESATGKRPFIFSRWGGLGNHRYPIGFSGDTHVTWETLAYQPYFTSTAANVGYGWWSHDIGGHCFGVEEDELYTRWVQYGVFSPVFRLHSTNNRFHERVPWRRGTEASRVAGDAMRLRHALIPYLYSMSWRSYQHDLQPITPMYHDYPEAEAAYLCANQYAFGSELIAAPHIFPMNSDTRLSRQVVWLPEGDWFGLFDGFRYPDNGWNAVYGNLDEIPVFAKAGAIVPLAPGVGWGGVDNPTALNLHIFPGADNRFELYEDDGSTTAYRQSVYSLTVFHNHWNEAGVEQQFTIDPVQGMTDHLPQRRAYSLRFRGIVLPDQVEIQLNGETIPSSDDYVFDAETETLIFAPMMLTPTDQLTITLRHEPGLMSITDHRLAICQKMVKSFRLNTHTKLGLHQQLPAIIEDFNLLGSWVTMLHESQTQSLLEVITGAGVDFITNASPQQNPVIFWNNRQDNRIHYRFHRRKDWWQQIVNGVLPNFDAHLIEKHQDWRAQVS
ncbi:MAG TPA: TIM-barrel domain-containing protein, partial [Phototrophicaceae bacterium]|nr:TIM-barrel domain-containing protein [Phototrophicaceae bacterium]